MCAPTPYLSKVTDVHDNKTRSYKHIADKSKGY
jgi:hypothetical protein